MTKAIIQLKVLDDGSMDILSSYDLTANMVTGYLVGAAIDMIVRSSDNAEYAHIYLDEVVQEAQRRINAEQF